MYSPNKKQDKEFALDLIEMIEVLARVGVKMQLPEALDLAEKFGEDYILLEKRIQTHDYTQEDELDERVQNYYENK